MVALETRNLSRQFGAVQACRDINVRLLHGEIVGMVGANGAGKTTLLNLITGYLKPTAGQIFYMQDDITGLPPREVSRKGLARSFQIPQLFSSLTVLENMLIAVAGTRREHRDFWRLLADRRRLDEAREILDLFGLLPMEHQAVDQLPQGARKLLDIAVAFAQHPKVLLLDEPTSGVSTSDKFPVMDTIIAALRQQGVTTLFVEHDMEVIARYAQRVLVLHEGRIIFNDLPQRVFDDETVRRLVVGQRARGRTGLESGPGGSPKAAVPDA
ncbi:MAG: ABC transporter ATP-binding protein [Limnochordales bacterium]|nr:ABC transporter ATP-binding protein [Limnochordales bacterium]